MRKVNLAVCALALSIASVGAQAATGGTITFNGKLISDTCTIADATADFTVTLPTLSTASLPTAGTQAGSTSFDIDVFDCPTTITQVAAHFEAIDSTGSNPTTGNLVNKAPLTPAGNAEIRLYNVSDSSQIRLGTTGEFFNVTPGVAPALGTAKLTYAGGYYATAATTPGLVTAQVQYVLAYP